jgi:hypothetical protein
MTTVRTLNFSSAVIGGNSVELRQGRLMIRTSDTGRYEWDASAEFRGVDTTLNQLSTRGDVRVEFNTRHDGTMAGQAFVEVSVSSGQGGTHTYLRLRGTGPLEGRVS